MKNGFIGVVDYGRGNLRSVAKAIEAAGGRARVSGKASDLIHAAGLVLPGVGAFGDAMRTLRAQKLDALIKAFEAEGRPMLGVCLGLQLFCRDSDEFGRHRGFGFFDAPVRKFPVGMKVPHMGWNDVKLAGGCPLFKGIPSGTHFYFVHSYRARLRQGADGGLGRANYGQGSFEAALWRRDLYAVQFHPEKSQARGLQVYRNFIEISRARGQHRSRRKEPQ